MWIEIVIRSLNARKKIGLRSKVESLLMAVRLYRVRSQAMVEKFLPHRPFSLFHSQPSAGLRRRFEQLTIFRSRPLRRTPPLPNVSVVFLAGRMVSGASCAFRAWHPSKTRLDVADMRSSGTASLPARPLVYVVPFLFDIVVERPTPPTLASTAPDI